jgi:Ser/Thr protein kinase RdoA (MazF antagonist)
VIPVLLMLVYPGPVYAGPVQAPAQRASDADRDIAADILCAAVGDGRLTLDELDGRLGAALSARTTTELAALIADLPGRRCATPTASPAAVPGKATARPAVPGKATARPAAPAPSRWQLIQSHCPAVRTPAGA